MKQWFKRLSINVGGVGHDKANSMALVLHKNTLGSQGYPSSASFIHSPLTSPFPCISLWDDLVASAFAPFTCSLHPYQFTSVFIPLLHSLSLTRWSNYTEAAGESVLTNFTTVLPPPSSLFHIRRAGVKEAIKWEVGVQLSEQDPKSGVWGVGNDAAKPGRSPVKH